MQEATRVLLGGRIYSSSAISVTQQLDIDKIVPLALDFLNFVCADDDDDGPGEDQLSGQPQPDPDALALGLDAGSSPIPVA